MNRAGEWAHRWRAALRTLRPIARGQLIPVTPAHLNALDAYIITLETALRAADVPPRAVEELLEVRFVNAAGTTCVRRSANVAYMKWLFRTYGDARDATLQLYDHSLGVVRASRSL